MREEILKELKVIGSVFMLIGGLVSFSLPLEYLLKGFYFAIPSTNLVFVVLTLIGVIIVLKGTPIAGGLLGVIVGIWMGHAGEFFIYRELSGNLVLLGGIISLIAGLLKLAKLKG